jgi:hypothetical protein
MTIFRYSKDGKLYSIIQTDKDGVKRYTAVPYGHSSNPITDCDIKDFSIQSIKNNNRNSSFL